MVPPNEYPLRIWFFAHPLRVSGRNSPHTQCWLWRLRFFSTSPCNLPSPHLCLIGLVPQELMRYQKPPREWWQMMPHLGNILSHSFSHLPLIPSFHQLLRRNFSGHSGWAEWGTFSEKGCWGHLVSRVIFTLHLADLLICVVFTYWVFSWAKCHLTYTSDMSKTLLSTV